MSHLLSVDDDIYEPRMPEVDVLADIEKIFVEAQRAAGQNGVDGKSRNVVVVTPGRVLMLQPCPLPGTMPAHAVSQMERMLPPKIKRKIAVIGYTDLKALTGNLAKAIPFFGMLTGMAYIGHSVWIFEGHASALAAGCKGADLLIADGAMVPHLPSDWQKLASSETPALEIFVHDRAKHTLRKVR